MNYVFSSSNNQKVIDTATTRINALLAGTGEKDSAVFCFGEDKHLILKNMRTYVRTVTDVLGENDYRVNHSAFDQIRRVYLQKLSERIGPLSDKTYQNCPALFDVFKFTVACSLDGIPAIFLSYYPNPNPNVSVCGLYEQPEFTLRVPLIYGSTSIYQHNQNKSAMIAFGISVQNLKRIRTRMRGIELPKGKQSSAKPEVTINDQQPPTQCSGEQSTGDYEEASGAVPSHISHEATIVDSIRARTIPVTHKRRPTITLR